MPDFVSQDTLDAARQARREQWEKAYKDAENPPPPPEEEPDYDPRTLYERLQEQKQKKEDAFREATKFGNLIKKLDGDEFDFLNNLHDEEDRKKRDMAEMEAQALEEFRSSVKSAAIAPPALVSLASTLGSTGISGTGSATSLLASTTAAASANRKPRKSAFSGLVVSKDSKKSAVPPPLDTVADSNKRKQDSSTTASRNNNHEGDDDRAAHASKKHKPDHGETVVVSSEPSTKDAEDKTTSGSKPAAATGLSSLVSYASDSSDED